MSGVPFETGVMTLMAAGQRDLSLRQLAVMTTLLRAPNTSTGHVAAAIGINKPAVTRAMQRLETEGLVHHVQDKADTRRICMSLTTAGVQLLARVGVIAAGEMG